MTVRIGLTFGETPERQTLSEAQKRQTGERIWKVASWLLGMRKGVQRA